MTRKNPSYELPDEVIAVLECSPNLEPCEEFRHADIHAFAEHLNERSAAVHCVLPPVGQRARNDSISARQQKLEWVTDASNGDWLLALDALYRRTWNGDYWEYAEGQAYFAEIQRGTELLAHDLQAFRNYHPPAAVSRRLQK